MKHDDKSKDDDHRAGSKSSSHAGAGAHSAPSSSHGAGPKKSEKPGDFDPSKLIDENGSFYGLPVSQDTASKLNTFGQMFIPWIRRNLQEKGEPIAQKFAVEQMGMEAVQAMRFGNKAAQAIGWATIFSKQIFDVGDNVMNTMKQLSALNAAARPMQRAGGDDAGSFASSDNEGLHNARSKINRLFMQRLANTAVSSVSAIPQYLIWRSEDAHKRVIDAKKAEFEAVKTKTPEEKAKWFKEQMTLKLPGGAMMDSQTKAAMMEMERKEYLENFEKFKSANRSTVEADLTKELKGFEKENQAYKLHNWERYGEKSLKHNIYNKEQYLLDKEIEYASRSGTKNTEGSEINYFQANKDRFEKERESLVKTQNKRLEATFKQFVEKELRARYVRQAGAYDDTWKNDMFFGEDKNAYGKNGYPQVETIKKQSEDAFKKLTEQLNGTAKEDAAKAQDPKKDEKDQNHVRDGIYGLAGGILGDVVSGMFGGKKLEEFKKPQAIGRVLHLQKVLVKAEGGNTPDVIPGIKYNKESEESCAYEKYVHKTFQQHQADSAEEGKQGFVEIGERYFEKFEKVKWNSDAIQKMSDDELTPYEYAVKHIAKRLKDGRLDGHAFGYLVFDARNKIVHDSGKDFGPTTVNGKDEAEVKQGIASLLDRVSQNAVAAHSMDEKAVSEALGRFSFSLEDIKTAFGPNGLPEDEKGIFFALISAHMPDHKVLCRVTGMSEAQCEKLRGSFQGQFERMLDAAVLELADMLKNNPAALGGLELTESEKKLLGAVAGKASKDGTDVTAAVADKKELQAVETVVANAVMALDGPGKPGGFWQKAVARSQLPKEKPPAAPPVPEKPALADKFAKPHDERKPARSADAHHEHEDDDEPAPRFADRHADKKKPDAFANKFHDRDDSREHRDDHAKSAGSHAERFKPPGDGITPSSMLSKLSSHRAGSHEVEDWSRA